MSKIKRAALRHPWCRLKGSYFRDEEFFELSPEAELLFVRSIAYSKSEQTIGRITPKSLRVLKFKLSAPVDQLAEQLVLEGLWVFDGDDGWLIANWAEWQDDHLSSKSAGRRGGLRSAHSRGSHKLFPNPDCDLCVDSSGETGEPPFEPPLEGSVEGWSSDPQPEVEVEVEVEVETSGTEQLKGVETEPLIVLDDFQTEERSDVSEVLQALLDVRRRVTGAPAWEPQSQKLRQWHESASLLCSQYGHQHVVTTLARVNTNLHPSLFKPFAQTPSKSRIGDAFAAVAAELGSTWSPGAKPVPVSTGPSGFELEQMRHQARQEIASWGDES